MAFEFNESAPIYLQILKKIKMDICSGHLQPGEKLPSVRDLAAANRVNPNTAQRVYQELEREGLTATQRGMGTFVTEDGELIASLRRVLANLEITTFLESMANIGFSNEEILTQITTKLEEFPCKQS